jgi:hypothetical protein
MIEPAAIYTADFEDAGPHPVIVVSRPALNRGPRGMLDPARFRDVIKAIGHVLGSDCEPV